MADGLSSPARPHLFGMVPEQLIAHLRTQGCDARPEEARRVLAQVITRGETDLRALPRPVARRVLDAVDGTTARCALELVERSEEDAVDGFVKYLFRSPDGALSEAVRIPLHKRGCYSLCLSSQVGCAMGCVFCATGRLGLTRSLLAWEMVSAFLTVRRDVPGRVTGVVFMGQGEPLHNYDEVLQAARVLSHPCGGSVDGRAISISTVGVARKIRRYTREGHRYRLITSLTSAIPERRLRLLPVAGREPLDELAEALREHNQSYGHRLTVAWVMLGGINTDETEVEALFELLGDVPLRINLIDVNDPTGAFRRPTDGERRRLMDRLQRFGAPVVRRYSGGVSCHAACGMLRNVRADASVPPT